MAAHDLALPDGTRLVHIGPHKTGTTAVQGALHLARERLAAYGVAYAGEGRHPWHAALAVTGRPALVGERPPRMADWYALTREVTATAARITVVSSEFFADGDDEAARRVITDLGGPRVHVVVTLRPFVKIISSQWQQYLQNRLRHGYDDWLDAIFNRPPYNRPTPTFWRRHRHDELVERWVAAAGDAERLTVIVVDDTDRRMLPRTFETLLGLPDGLLVPERTATNRSLTSAEAELIRLLNREFKQRAWPDRLYSRYLRFGAVAQLKTGRLPQPAEPRIAAPAWAVERAAQIGAAAADRIGAMGVRVVGDIAALGRVPGADAAPEPPGQAGDPDADRPGGPAALPASAAAQAVIGAIIASGDPDPRALRLEDRRVHDVTAAQLLGVLLKRVRRRLGGAGRASRAA